jgi:hypothetical protein
MLPVVVPPVVVVPGSEGVPLVVPPEEDVPPVLGLAWLISIRYASE